MLQKGSSFCCLSPLLMAGLDLVLVIDMTQCTVLIPLEAWFFSVIISIMILSPASTEGDPGSQGASSTAKHCLHGSHGSFYPLAPSEG